MASRLVDVRADIAWGSDPLGGSRPGCGRALGGQSWSATELRLPDSRTILTAHQQHLAGHGVPGERAIRRPARHGLAEPAPGRPPGGSARRAAAPAVRPPRAALT